MILTIERKLMFNAILRAVLESYFALSLSMWYAWRNARADPRAEFLVNLAITAFCFLFPIWQHQFLSENLKLGCLKIKIFRQIASKKSNSELLKSFSKVEFLDNKLRFWTEFISLATTIFQ